MKQISFKDFEKTFLENVPTSEIRKQKTADFVKITNMTVEESREIYQPYTFVAKVQMDSLNESNKPKPLTGDEVEINLWKTVGMSGRRKMEQERNNQKTISMYMQNDKTWDDYIKHAHIYAANDAIKTFELKKWQLHIIENDIDSPAENISYAYSIYVAIPNTENNKTVFKSFMNIYGYFLCREEPINYGKYAGYVYLMFEPYMQPLLNAFLGEVEYAYHITSSNNDEYINKYGLKAGNKNSKYKYSDRVFVILMYQLDYDQIQAKRVARMLLTEKEGYNPLKINGTSITVWEIDMKRAIDMGIEFYQDFTMILGDDKSPTPLYTEQSIPREIIRKRDTFEIIQNQIIHHNYN